MLQMCCLFLIAVSANFISCAEDNVIWYPYQFGTEFKNKEELIVTDLELDDNFNLREDVSRWKSICTGKKCYAAGLLENGFILLVAELGPDKKNFITSSDVVELDESFTDVELFEYWNKTSKQSELILVGTSGGLNYQILWYKIVEERLQHILTWDIYGPAMYLRYFTAGNNTHHLLVLAEGHKGRNVDLYTFSDFGGVHSLDPLISTSTSTNELALNWYGSDMYISIPQPVADKILIYKLTSEYGFEAYQDLVLNGITHINSFKIGFQSFLAVGGKNAGIYKFTKTNLVRQNIKGLNLDSINFWFPVPVKSYRDEVVLILQRSISQESRKAFLPEVVFHNGNEFSLHDEISCTVFGELEKGLSCLFVEDRYNEGFEAAVLSLGNTVGILVPRRNNSRIFTIHTEIKKLKSPVQLEVEKLKETRQKLQQMIEDQQSQIKDIRNRLRHSIRLNKTNVISAPWKLNMLSVRALKQRSETIVPRQPIEDVNIQELNNLVNNIHNAVQYSQKQLENTIPLNKTLNRFNTLMVDGQVEPRHESKFKIVMIEKFNDEPVYDTFKDLVRTRNINPIFGPKTFANMKVENITFDDVNEMSVDNIIPNTGAPIIVHNGVLFDQPITVTGNVTIKTKKINDLKLSNEVIEMNKEYEDSLTFEYIKADAARADNLPVQIHVEADRKDNEDEIELSTARIPGNVTVENVNGENFAQFLKTLCFTNSKTHIHGDIIITGNMDVEKNAAITNLNDLKFPQEYIVAGLESSEITAKKSFQGEMFAKEVTASGTINEVNTDNILTLTKNQSLIGNFIFSDFQVIENLRVDGKTIAPHVTNYLPNPTLTQTNKIAANVNFKSLEVDGNVIVSGKLNKIDLSDIMNDVLYKEEKEATITSTKDFLGGITVINGIHLQSNSINSNPINSFITKNTEQTITFPSLKGHVNFKNLLLGGLYADVNITKLDQETIKLNGDQYVSSTLIFDNNLRSFVDLMSTDFAITETLNNLTVRDYMFTTEASQRWANAMQFDSLQAENIFIEGDLAGSLRNFSVRNFAERRMSLSKDQTVTAKFNIRNLEVEDLQVNIFNGEPFSKNFDFEYCRDKVFGMLAKGKLHITNLQVNGSVFVENINGESTEELLANASIRIDKSSSFETAVFYGDVTVYNLHVRNIVGKYFKNVSDNIVYKKERNLFITSFKKFTNGFYVTKKLTSKRLNNIHVDHILRNIGPQHISGKLNIYGDVSILFNCQVEGHLNDVDVKYLFKSYKFSKNTCIINDDFVMDRASFISSLQVDGFANEENLEEFLPNMVTKSYNAKMLQKVIFQNSVHIHKNMSIANTVNDMDISEYVQNMVFINDEHIQIPITFTKMIDVAEKLVIKNSLDTHYLMGIDLNNWFDDAVFINKGKLLGKIKFQSVTVNGNMKLNYLNDVNLTSLIPLHTEQIIDAFMNFTEIISFEDISVGNYVNGYRMVDEYRSTLLTTGDIQDITTKLTFHGNVTAENTLTILDLVNGKNLSTVVTTNTDQQLNATYNFMKTVFFTSNLTIEGFLNKLIPFYWQRATYKTYYERVQYIKDNWTVNSNITFSGNVRGSGRIAGMDIKQLARDLQAKSLFKFYTDPKSGLLAPYTKMCEEMCRDLDNLQKQIYRFKYLESLQILEIDHTIKYVYHFKQENKHYVLINEEDSCLSHLLIWSKMQFQALKTIRTGGVKQFISVYDGDTLFLISRDNEISNCSIAGTNAWKFVRDDIIHLFKLEDNQIELLQESLLPGIFYGLIGDFVVEFKLVTTVETYFTWTRTWRTDEKNLKFLPQSLGIGLALHNDYRLFKLRREPVLRSKAGITVTIILGLIIEINTFLPRYEEGNLLVMNVGTGALKRNLVAIASREETSIKDRVDVITIYENIQTGKIFHKVATYKPSSLISLEFDNGETLLIFLEDRHTLQVYEYKGIEGFTHRTSAKLEASKLIVLSVPIEGHKKDTNVIAAINENKINFIQPVMIGNQLVVERPLCKF